MSHNIRRDNIGPSIASLLNPEEYSQDIKTIKILMKITMVAVGALSLTAAATIASNPVGGSIMLAGSILALVITRDFYVISTNVETMDSKPLREMGLNDILDNVFWRVSVSARINKATDGTIFKPIWRLMLNTLA
jgi:hypothetical protein